MCDVTDLPYLGCELPLGVFSCHQMLRELLVLQSMLSTHKTHKRRSMYVGFLFNQSVFCASANADRFGLFLQVDNLREQVCDFLLLAGRILCLPRQFLCYGGDLKTGLSWRSCSEMSYAQELGFNTKIYK